MRMWLVQRIIFSDAVREKSRAPGSLIKRTVKIELILVKNFRPLLRFLSKAYGLLPLFPEYTT